jgi:hypothetical protein
MAGAKELERGEDEHRYQSRQPKGVPKSSLARALLEQPN